MQNKKDCEECICEILSESLSMCCFSIYSQNIRFSLNVGRQQVAETVTLQGA